ncbi:MAG TPA: ribosome maturation factor RimP [Candidatus Binataceae bacterium]|nr:ribosome maturation factor RimP [Candidatus Binataceae bacterium]
MTVLTLNPVEEKVAALLAPHLERQGYELVAVQFHRGARSSLLRILADRPGGGISLADLEKLSPTLGDLLDVYDPIEGRYTMEVASPGLNRPLRKLEHFQAGIGGRIRVRTHQARDGQKSFVGRLVAVSDTGIELADEAAGKRVAIEFGEMKDANVEYEFGK